MANKKAKSKKAGNKWVAYLAYLLVRLGAMVVQMIPVPTLYALTRGAGSLAFVVDRKHRRRMLEHIGRSFPQWDPRRVHQVARESMQAIALLGMEMIITPRMISLSSFHRHISFNRIDELLSRMVAGRSGVIVATSHFGNWEVSGYTMAALDLPATVVARPLDNPYVDRYLRGIRQEKGLRIVDKKGAASVVDETLINKGVVCFVADQDAGRKGVFVDFFGRPASTYRSIALLAIRYNLPIVTVYAKRLADDFSFEIGTAGTITPDQWAGRDDEVQWITQTYTHMLESLIRTDPGQYFGWAHRRWKHQPRPRKAKPQRR